MARPEKLSEVYITEHLKNLHFWKRDGDSILREIVTKNFTSAVGLINSIAILAETMDHHPDILLYGWNKLRITLSTHDQGGLTDLDFKLAKKIEEIGF